MGDDMAWYDRIGWDGMAMGWWDGMEWMMNDE